MARTELQAAPSSNEKGTEEDTYQQWEEKVMSHVSFYYCSFLSN